MYTLIIFAIVGGFISYLDANKGNPFNWGIFIMGLFKTALIYFIVLGIGRAVYVSNNDLNTEEYKDLSIVSFGNKDGWKVNGTFVLGTGGISGGNYTYYVTYGKFNNGLKRMELNTRSYYLKETNSKSPCIPKYWKINVRKGYESKWWWNRKYSKDQYMIENYNAKTVVVPTNTVFKHFDVKD
jgi:hypothetical protein